MAVLPLSFYLDVDNEIAPVRLLARRVMRHWPLPLYTWRGSGCRPASAVPPPLYRSAMEEG